MFPYEYLFAYDSDVNNHELLDKVYQDCQYAVFNHLVYSL